MIGRRELLGGAGSLAFLGGCAVPQAPVIAASDGHEPLRRIAFGSCIDQTKPAPIWDTIIASKPDLFVFGGDNVYCEMPYSLAALRRAYALAAASAGMSRLRRSVPHIAIWDDHDYGVNDGGAEFPKKDEAQIQFLDFLGVTKDSPRRAQKGVYHAELFGPPEKRTQIIVLDTRYFRGPLAKRGKFIRDEGPYVPSTDKTSTMLGEAQ